MKALWKGGGAYGLANASIAGSQFAVILVFAAALPPADFGQVSIFAVLTVVLSMVIGMGLAAAVQRSFFELQQDDYQRFIGGVVRMIAGVALVLVGVVALAPGSAIELLSLPRGWVFFALIAATAQAIAQLVLVVLQTREQISMYLRMASLQVLTAIVVALAFHASQSEAWQDALVAQAVAPVVTAVVGLVLLASRGDLRGGARYHALGAALKYALPLVPHQVAGWVMSMVDRFIIASTLGLAPAGVYSLSFQIAQATNIISNSFNQALVPIVFRQLAATERQPNRLWRLNRSYALGLLAFSTIFMLGFTFVAPYMLSPDYQQASELTPWLILAFFLLAASRIASNFLLYFGRTGLLAASTLLAALASLILNFILVPRFGVVGACWTSAATFLLLLVVTSWSARRCYLRQS